jgi:hypothetical protein
MHTDLREADVRQLRRRLPRLMFVVTVVIVVIQYRIVKRWRKAFPV